MEIKTKCNWCGASILEATAARCRGRCVPCSRKSWFYHVLFDLIIPRLQRSSLERYLSRVTLEEIRPTQEVVEAAAEFASFFDSSGELAGLVHLAATDPEAALRSRLHSMGDARNTLKTIAVMAEKEKAYHLYQRQNLLADIIKDFLNERELAAVYDYDVPPEELVDGFSEIKVSWTADVDWDGLRAAVGPIESPSEYLGCLAGLLRPYRLAISLLRQDPNDLCVVVREEDFDRIQGAARRAGIFNIERE